MTLLGHVRDDVPGFTDLVNEWYRIIGEAVFVAVALVIMLSIDPVITLVAFLPMAGVVLLTHWARTRLPHLVGRAREATVAVTNFIGNAFGGVQTVKVSGAEERVTRRFASLNQVRAKAEVKTQATQAWIDAITEATVVAGSGLVLLVGANAMLNEQFSVGDFMLFATYLDWMLQLPRRLGRLLSQRRTSGKSVERLQEALGDTPAKSLVQHRSIHLTGPLPEVRNPQRLPTDRLEVLRVEDLSYRYESADEETKGESNGNGQGIAGVSFTVPRGSITVITGELGSGKSTLLEVLLGLRRAQQGRILWNDTEVTDPAEFMVPPRVAYKPQLPRLFSESLRDNVLLGWEVEEGAVDRALARVSLDQDVKRMPDGLQTLVGPRGTRLSGGQLQRVGAARMLVRDCELNVIDDLASALDDTTEQEIWEQIEESRRDGHTYLMVSHRPNALRQADQIIVLSQGRVACVGTLAEVTVHSAVVRRILDHPDRSGAGA